MALVWKETGGLGPYVGPPNGPANVGVMDRDRMSFRAIDGNSVALVAGDGRESNRVDAQGVVEPDDDIMRTVVDPDTITGIGEGRFLAVKPVESGIHGLQVRSSGQGRLQMDSMSLVFRKLEACQDSIWSFHEDAGTGIAVDNTDPSVIPGPRFRADVIHGCGLPLDMDAAKSIARNSIHVDLVKAGPVFHL